MRVGKKTSAFRSTLNQRLSSVAGGFALYPAMFEITGGIPEPIFSEPEEAESLGENGTPLLEVRRCGDGHPPVTKREREIRLNGISGVII